MEHQEIQDTFLDYIEGELSAEERRYVAEHLESCPQCRSEYESYQSLVKLEKLEAQRVFTPVTDIAESVLCHIEERSGIIGVSHEVQRRDRALIASLVSMNVILSLVLLVLLHAQSSQRFSHQVASNSNASLAPPPGYEMITVQLKKGPKAVQKVHANVHADVQVALPQEGSSRYATIAPFVKVLAVEGAEGENMAGWRGAPMVTLLVTEEQAERIKRAQVLGDLTLSLIDPNKINGAANRIEAPNIIYDPDGRPVVKPNHAGFFVLYLRDSNKGFLRHEWKNGMWTPVSDSDVTIF